jgi:hypothetical protein
MSNLLKGRNVAEISNTPRTTGVPGIDLLRKSNRRPFGMKKRKVKRVVKRRRPSGMGRRKFFGRRRPQRMLRRRR